jgi:uncharacterized protein YoxC
MRRKTDEQTAGELRIELRQVRAAVSKILDDYEQTAKTVDELTAQIDGVETTEHATDVQLLKNELLTALQSDSDTVKPPWERQGYATKQAWLDEQ